MTTKNVSRRTFLSALGAAALSHAVAACQPAATAVPTSTASPIPAATTTFTPIPTAVPTLAPTATATPTSPPEPTLTPTVEPTKVVEPPTPKPEPTKKPESKEPYPIAYETVFSGESSNGTVVNLGIGMMQDVVDWIKANGHPDFTEMVVNPEADPHEVGTSMADMVEEMVYMAWRIKTGRSENFETWLEMLKTGEVSMPMPVMVLPVVELKGTEVTKKYEEYDWKIELVDGKPRINVKTIAKGDSTARATLSREINSGVCFDIYSDPDDGSLTIISNTGLDENNLAQKVEVVKQEPFKTLGVDAQMLADSMVVFNATVGILSRLCLKDGYLYSRYASNSEQDFQAVMDVGTKWIQSWGFEKRKLPFVLK